jgi:hypothetical protein
MLMMTNLCGFMAGQNVLSSLSVFATANDASATSSITCPSNVVAGDLICFFEDALSASGQAIPSGFTLISGTLITNNRAVWSYKIATGTEGGTSITGMTGGTFYTKVLLIFRGDVPISAVTVASVNQQATAGDPTAQTVTASSGVPPLVVLASYTTGTGPIATRTFSPAEDAEIIPAGALNTEYIKYKIYNASPSNTTVDMPDAGVDNGLHSSYLACA